MAAKLSAYEAKRDFTKTAEPSGAAEVKPSKQRRFVIQKHAATRLHYDLRLEHEGVFLSWAVTKGPSLDPADKRLAVEVEDHPLAYGDFEGTIPKGEYGGGTVMLWDRGWWEPQDGMDVAKGLKKGELKVVFHGRRMQGSWVLVRMNRDRTGGKRTNWLMIKHRDEHAVEGDDDAFLKDNAVSIASKRPMEQIAAGKGRAPSPFMTAVKRTAAAVWNSNRSGDPEASAEAAARAADAPKAKAKQRPGKRAAMPDFVPPQLTRLVDHPPRGREWVHEIKFDGYRMQLRVEKGKAALRTRKGLEWTKRFPEIARDAAALPDCLLDAEIVALDSHDRPDFAGLQAALSSGKTGGLVAFVFDALFIDGRDLRDLPLSERKTALEALLEGDQGPSGRLRFVDHFESAGQAVLDSACRMDLEGIVSKRLDKPYRSGRSDDWTKAKCRGGQEVIIAGWATTGESFRSLIAAVRRDGKLVHVGRIGTGFGRDKVAALLPRLKALETDASPFGPKDGPKKTAGLHWVKPKLVAEIGFAGWTGDGHLRQASFKGLREDKTAEDVVLEQPVEAEKVESAGGGKAKAAGSAKPSKAGNVVLGLTISNPDKTLWPAEGDEPAHTKLELARYFEAMAPLILPHIRGRPCSLIRAPDGIGGQRFFQRHAGAGSSSLFTLVDVRGDKKPYVQLDSAEALVAAAQSGGIELHPWNCLEGDPEHPGRLVFDLDPDPSVGFDKVIEAAKAVRERLEQVGLVGFLKTTGGKGLHVVTPLAQPARGAKVEWPEAKQFARDLCATIMRDAPDDFTLTLAKKARGGKIFLDYLRNDRLSTAVAVLSPRAREGATVSMPLAWTQARKGLNPKKYTIVSAPALMRKSDPWADYEAAARPIKEAMRKLKKV